ncbi:MAG: CotH kinase family protein [Akkermansiaceae bacterium]
MQHTFRLLQISFLTFLVSSLVGATPVITEFQASNSSTLADEDGDTSDWIEIFNPDASSVDLSGFYLTDDPGLPTKWQIPAGTVLNPSSFLVVFASDKNRAVVDSQLHTNFKISSAGEYLGLIAADGVTVLSEYVAPYPPQFEDASYGLQQLGNTNQETLIETGANCTVLVPTNGSLGTSWTANGFNDSSWTSGTTGVGYERSSGYDSFFNIDVEAQMFDQRTSAYLRVPFSVTDVGEIAALELQLQYDDGFVAYLNGVEVARDRASGAVTWSSAASGDHTDSLASQFTPFNLSTFTSALVEGNNVLAIHGLNRGTTSSDFLIRPRLIGTRLSNPSLGQPGYFLTPTPGAINGTEQGLPASDVTISVPSQTFTSSFQVSLGGAEVGQEIRYTLDGSVPTASSALYTSPLMISQSTQLRARIVGAGNAAGPIAMATYIFLTSDVANFSSNLPIVILDNWNSGKPNSDTDGFWAIIEPDATGDQRSHMTADLAIATRCNMRVRGSSSSGFAKYSLSLESQDEAKEDQNIEPLGMPPESDWVLSGRYTFDRALMRNPLIYQLSNETGEYAVRTRFVEVFLNTGGGNLTYAGDYFGVYTLMEKIKRDDERIGVKRLSTGSITEPEVSGGYLWKKDRLDPGDRGFSVNSMGTFGWVFPKEEEVAPAQSTWLRNHLNEFDAALYNANWTNPTTGRHFTEYIDNFSWLRHHWLNTLAMNVDGFRLSGYYYKHHDETNGGKVGAGPIWDFDRTMGSTDSRDNNPSQWDGSGDSSRTYGDSRFPWWGRALQNPDFRQEHTDLWQELRKSTFSTSNIHSIIDEFVAQLDFQDPGGINSGLGRSPQARNFNRWTQVRPSGGYANQINVLKNWLSTRTNWIDSQYTSQPSFTVSPGLVAAGTNVSFSGAGGTVYYTTDGSDPRLPGGNVSLQALTSGPVNVGSTTMIRARARSGTGLTSWSGEIQGNFLVGNLANASNLVISEVHYAPAPPSPTEAVVSADPSDYEWIELTNISGMTIELTDVRFDAGIDFTFTGSSVTTLAPGAKVLVVRNQAAFEARYGLGLSSTIAGEFAPSRLDNAGERIHLVNALGATIQDFTYNDSLPWPTESGFPGYSLVLISNGIEVPDHSDASSWRSSALVGGSPAGTDRVALVGNGLDDDDQDGLQKFLEHALGTSDSDGGEGNSVIQFGVENFIVNDLEDPYITITFQRSLAADDVEVRVETATDLTTWSSGESAAVLVSRINDGNGLSTVKYRSAVPFDSGADPSWFFRLVAESR